VLEQIAPFSEQVSEELVRAWFGPIVLTVANPRPAEQIDPYIAALMLALDGLPVRAFTEATQRDLLRRCTHWPAAAEVYAVVSPAAKRIWEDVAGLQRIIAAPTKTERGPIMDMQSDINDLIPEEKTKASNVTPFD
jgi:hypothetical protein